MRGEGEKPRDKTRGESSRPGGMRGEGEKPLDKTGGESSRPGGKRGEGEKPRDKTGGESSRPGGMRGEGEKPRDKTGGESSRSDGMRGESERVGFSCGLSKSEEYAESRPREGGVFVDRSRGAGEERDGATILRGMLQDRGAEAVCFGGRGPMLFSVLGGGG